MGPTQREPTRHRELRGLTESAGARHRERRAFYTESAGSDTESAAESAGARRRERGPTQRAPGPDDTESGESAYTKFWVLAPGGAELGARALDELHTALSLRLDGRHGGRCVAQGGTRLRARGWMGCRMGDAANICV